MALFVTAPVINKSAVEPDALEMLIVSEPLPNVTVAAVIFGKAESVPAIIRLFFIVTLLLAALIVPLIVELPFKVTSPEAVIVPARVSADEVFPRVKAAQEKVPAIEVLPEL